MKVAIIGNGIVGGTLREWLDENTLHEIVVYDPPQGHAEPIGNVDAAFIAVPVPTKAFKQDLSILKDAIRVAETAGAIFVRSSVLPGTCDKLSEEFGRCIYAMPEFLTERSRREDFAKQDLVLGTPNKYDTEANFFAIEDLIQSLFGEQKKVFMHTALNCEMAKYAHNCFGALKVTYFNAIHDLCKKHKMNFERVKSIMLMSGYINDVHTLVPGPDGKGGFGGKCFPKDLAAFMGWVGGNPSYMLLKDVFCLNRYYRGEKDYDDGSVA